MAQQTSMPQQPRSGASRKAIYVGIILILVVVVIGALAFLLMNKGSTPSADLKITQYEREYDTKTDIGGGDYMWFWTVSIKIDNRGSNTVNGAQLMVELKAPDHTTINSDSSTFTLQAGWETTEHAIIQARQSSWLSKDCVLIATIYVGNQVIDQYTANW